MKTILLLLLVACGVRADEWQIVNTTHGNVNLVAFDTGLGAEIPFAVVPPGVTVYVDDSSLFVEGPSGNTLSGLGLSALQWADGTGGLSVSSAGVALGNGRVHWLTLLDMANPSEGTHFMGCTFYDQMTFTSAFFAGFGVTLVIGLYQWGKRVVEKIIAPSGGL